MSYTTEAVENRLLTGAVRGVLSAFNVQGEPLVDFCGNLSGCELVAITTIPIRHEDIGKEVVLLFEDGDPARPLLVGIVQSPALPKAESHMGLDVSVDGQKLTLAAEREISIRCGEASITLTREGKVFIKGNYLLSKATGPNRIKGGSVQLN